MLLSLTPIPAAAMGGPSHAFGEGLLLMAGLIVAVGAQNAYVLKQALQRRHLLAVLLFCMTADATLVGLGVFGLGRVLTGSRVLLEALRFGGVAFLAGYGIKSLRAAIGGTGASLVGANGDRRESRRSVLTTLAAVTLLNPHVYLDTVVLVGGVGSRYGDSRLAFALGASAASVLWFSMHGFGAHRLSGVLARPAVWRGIDSAAAVVMFAMAARLVTHGV